MSKLKIKENDTLHLGTVRFSDQCSAYINITATVHVVDKHEPPIAIEISMTRLDFSKLAATALMDGGDYDPV